MTSRAPWDPAQYLRFADERARPALDLIARIPLDAPARAVDLGCGPGNSTALLAARWPGAQLVGVDGDAAMLALAERDHPGWVWRQADIARWVPDEPPALIFSNAALHWVPDHAALFPRLLAAVAPGGALAVQMPRNQNAPSHRLMNEVAQAGPWRARLAVLPARQAVEEPEWYYDLLTRRARRVEIWETVYSHVLAGAGAVLDWMRGSGLRPYLAPLDEAERRAFAERYGALLEQAYPARADGRVLFPFRRLFLVALP